GPELRLGIVTRDGVEKLLLQRPEIRPVRLRRDGRRGRAPRAARLRSGGSGLPGRPSVVPGGRGARLGHARRIAAGPPPLRDQPPGGAPRWGGGGGGGPPPPPLAVAGLVGWGGLGSRTVPVPRDVATPGEPPGPIVSAPTASTGPAWIRMTLGSLSVALDGR